MLDWSEMMKNFAEPVYLSSPVGLSLCQSFYIQVSLCIRMVTALAAADIAPPLPQALMSTESVVARVGMLDKSFHLLTLKPAFIIHNLLPMAVTIVLDVS